MTFETFKEENLGLFDEYLSLQLRSHNDEKSAVTEAMLYSVEAGGKRLRPLILMAVLESFGKDASQGFAAAASLEYIHTYSLIHDDLPAMDDDDLRRGKPTNHVVHGEATAILAGDGLLTFAFENLMLSDYSADEKVFLANYLAKKSGVHGMVGGQQADMEGEDAKLSLEELTSIHDRKTGALIQFALVAGAYLAGARPESLTQFENLGKSLGIAYQIRDDILDVTSSTEELGKTAGSDLANQKSTYPALLGLDGAYGSLENELQGNLDLLEDIRANERQFSTELLVGLVNSLRLETQYDPKEA